MPAPTIDLVSDVVCPWCFIGARRVVQALAAEGLEGTRITFHPFLLDPSTPSEGEDLRTRLRAKYGADPEAMFARVEAVARESGIPLDFGKVRLMPSTVRAHTLLRHAKAKDTQLALALAIFEAYFLEGADIGSEDVLVALGTRHGFTEPEARALLGDARELDATRAEAAQWSRRGITGVPFTIFGGELAVAGAQPLEVFREALTRSLR